jgi:hypothetical protein
MHREQIMSTKSLATLTIAITVAACADPTSIVIEPLRVINWSPGSGAFCVDVNAAIAATFSDDLVADSLTSESLYVLYAGGTVDAALSYDEAVYTARLTPDEPLSFDTLYTIVATKEIRGREQGRLAVDLEASFLTRARQGCKSDVECSLPSDCPGTQICANIGVCIDECVTDKDCYRGTCASGTCIPESDADGGDPGGD